MAEDKALKKYRSRWPVDYVAGTRIQVTLTPEQMAWLDRVRGTVSRAAELRAMVAYAMLRSADYNECASDYKL